MIFLYIISSILLLSSFVYAEELACMSVEQAKMAVVELEQKKILEKEVEELSAEVDLLKKQNELLKKKIKLVEEQKELQDIEIKQLKQDLSKQKKQSFFEAIQNLGIGVLIGVVIGGLLL
jgi:peptidoglycan hydrolase CwlO-like protein